MTRFFEFLISLVIVTVLFLLVGVFLPNRRHVEHSMETNHPVRQVYDTINSFKRFGDWNPLRMHDPAVQYTTEGPERGVGAKLNYVSQKKKVGTGSWEIVNSEQDSQVEFALQNPSYGDNKTAVFTLEEQGKTVDITWEYDVEYGWDLFGRYAGLYVSRNVGDDIKLGLGNLVGLLATMPNFDYSTIDVRKVPIHPRNVLYVSTTADRNITAVENAMILALKDIRAAIAANGLEASGPARLITTNFGNEKYEFDVAIPVQRPGETAAETALGAPVAPPAAAAPAEGEVPADAAPAEPEVPAETTGTADAATPAEIDLTIEPAPAPLEGLNLPSNVLAGQSYAGRALVTEYQGHPAALPLIRDMLRSYAASHGETIHDRSFEEYLSEITETAPEEARFNVYWPIQ
jgi:hypothetical protein